MQASATDEDGTWAATPKAVTVQGLSAPASKVYDGTRDTSVLGSATLAASRSAVRARLDAWFDHLGLRPRVVGEFEDSALLKTFGAAGLGVFPAPEVVQADLLTIGASNVQAFAGLNGGTADELGLKLTDVEFGIALITEQAPPPAGRMATASWLSSRSAARGVRSRPMPRPTVTSAAP